MIFDPILDIFRGKAVTIPPMDGALKPNTALDEAPVALEIEAPDNLCSDGERLIFSSHEKVFAWQGGRIEEIQSFDAPVTALAVSSAGDLAIGLTSLFQRMVAGEGDDAVQLRIEAGDAVEIDGGQALGGKGARLNPPG